MKKIDKFLAALEATEIRPVFEPGEDNSMIRIVVAGIEVEILYSYFTTVECHFRETRDNPGEYEPHFDNIKVEEVCIYDEDLDVEGHLLQINNIINSKLQESC